MDAIVPAADFAARDDLPDWRYLLGRLEATFRADGFTGAGRFVAEIAAAADREGHHPDIDVRYPDRVHVALTTHASGGLVTGRDLSLASVISRLAVEAGATSEPLAAIDVEVALDALDIDAVRPFWAAVLGYVEGPADDDGTVTSLVDPVRIGPPFWFQQMEEPRRERNRFHIDVTVPHDIAEQRVEAALAAGGTLVTDRFARSWWVLADPEGNEACVCTWQDRA